MSKCRSLRWANGKVVLTAAFASILSLWLTQSASAQETCAGIPTVYKFVTPQSVESGDPVTVTITVKGCSGELANPIPFDGVLLIDMSGSMGPDWPYNDPDDLRLGAAKSFVDCAPPGSRLAAVTFADDAEIVQGLTTDKAALKSAIDGLYDEAGGKTNMWAGMDTAQKLLIDNPAQDLRPRYIILLTDGYDNSGRTPEEIKALALGAKPYDIHYLTIALGYYADGVLLNAIAELTGGEYCESPQASDLQVCYTTACQTASKVVKTRMVTLHEKLMAGLVVKAGTVASDTELTAEQIQHFVETGEIAVNWGALGSGELRGISFDIADNCLTPDSEETSVGVQIDDDSSEVTYRYGLSGGTVKVPTGEFECRKPGDLRVRKDYDPATGVLTIELESRYLAKPGEGPGVHALRDVTVVERPSVYFQPILESASPPLDYVFPDPNGDSLLWGIGGIGPQRTKNLSIKLEPLVCSGSKSWRYGYQAPIDVNGTKRTGGPGQISYRRPDGTTKRIPMPFWKANLPYVEPCDGRADMHITAALTSQEYSSPPALAPDSVLAHDESPDIWADSLAGNGFWDGAAQTISDHIRGASAVGPTVRGQGDLFYAASENRIMARVLNVGSKASPCQASLYVYNYGSGSWDEIASQDLASLSPWQPRLATFDIHPNTIGPDHIRPYAIPLADVWKLISALAPGLYNQMSLNPVLVLGVAPALEWVPWHDPNPIVPELLPEQFRSTYVSPVLWDAFDNFLSVNAGQIAWGKPSFKAKVVLGPGEAEKHTNNNSATEIMLLAAQ